MCDSFCHESPHPYRGFPNGYLVSTLPFCNIWDIFYYSSVLGGLFNFYIGGSSYNQYNILVNLVRCISSSNIELEILLRIQQSKALIVPSSIKQDRSGLLRTAAFPMRERLGDTVLSSFKTVVAYKLIWYVLPQSKEPS